MADKKISQLTALSAANLAPSTDVLAIVDTSATETKKIVAQDLINGVLNVASAVGIGTASPTQKLTVAGNILSLSAAGTDGYVNAATNGVQNTYLGFNNSGSTNAAGALNNYSYVGNGNNYGVQIISNGSAVATFTNTGNLGIGTTSPAYKLDVNNGGGSVAGLRVSGNDQANVRMRLENSGSGGRTWELVGGLPGSNNANFSVRDVTGSTTPLTLDASGNLGVGTTSPSYTLDISEVGGTNGIVDAARFYADAAAAAESRILFGTAANTVSAAIGSQTDTGSTSILKFYIDSAGGLVERGRFSADGNFLVGTTNENPAANNVAGHALKIGGLAEHSNTSSVVLRVNRKTDDGTLVEFLQDGTAEGDISVSGTTVSYNGGHLSRWSQTTDNTRIPLLKGTVMSNLDQMAVWEKDGQPLPNEQLNCMKVSDVEGDVNVAGVFVNWGNDDDVYANDMNVAMTGDMIIRIAQGVVVQRGDLLMSAGDGTAKPQGDDIRRSKTIAKVTSNHVTCTYEDGSYCVPCVLMAC